MIYYKKIQLSKNWLAFKTTFLIPMISAIVTMILMVYVIFDFNHMPTLKYVGGTTNYNNYCCEIFGPIPAMTTSERSWKLFTSLWCERPFLKHRIKLLALIISICVLHTTLIMLHRYEFAIETG